MKEEYLQLLRQTLTGESFRDSRNAPFLIRKIAALFGYRACKGYSPPESYPKGYPMHSMTMVTPKGLDIFRNCIESVINDKIPGDIVECGVWRGGASIFAKGVLYANNDISRRVHLFDTFSGLPRPTIKQDEDSKMHWLGDVLGIPLEEVRENFRRHGLLDDNVKFVQGLFRDTLPNFDRKIAVLRADGDMYESTMDILINLYDLVEIGGHIIIDDYHLTPCAEALGDFFKSRGINPKLKFYEKIPNGSLGSCYWQKLNA